MEIVSYLTNIKEDINDIAMGKVNAPTPLLKSLTAQLNVVIEQLQNTSSNSEYKSPSAQCPKCGELCIYCQDD